jgi:hypothetical protein
VGDRLAIGDHRACRLSATETTETGRHQYLIPAEPVGTNYEGDYENEMGIGREPEFRPVLENPDVSVPAP